MKRSSPFFKFLNDDQNRELMMLTENGDAAKLAEIDKLVLSKKEEFIEKFKAFHENVRLKL